MLVPGNLPAPRSKLLVLRQHHATYDTALTCPANSDVAFETGSKHSTKLSTQFGISPTPDISQFWGGWEQEYGGEMKWRIRSR